MSAWLASLSLKNKMGGASPPKVPEIIRTAVSTPKEEIKRNNVGTVIWVAATFYFLIYPLAAIILLITNAVELPSFYAVPEWTCWAGLGAMFVYGMAASLGCFRPFAKVMRIIVAVIFLLGLGFNVGLAVYTLIGVETFYLHSGINAFFLVILGVGMLFGYRSKLAKVFLPFRVVKS